MKICFSLIILCLVFGEQTEGRGCTPAFADTTCIDFSKQEDREKFDSMDKPANIDGSYIYERTIPTQATINSCRFCHAHQAIANQRNLSGIDFESANFIGVRGAFANFSNSNLANAQFTGARIHRSIFRNANLKGVDFRYADLSFVDFRGANLEGANLTGALVLGANFEGAKISESTVLPKGFSAKQQDVVKSDGARD